MTAKKNPKFESYQQSNFKNQWSFNSWNFEGKKNCPREAHVLCKYVRYYLWWSCTSFHQSNIIWKKREDVIVIWSQVKNCTLGGFRKIPFILVQSNEPDQTQPKFGLWGPTRPKIGFKLGSFGFIKYIIGLNPNLSFGWIQIWTLIEANLTRLDPTQPKFWVQNRVQPKKNGYLAAKYWNTYYNNIVCI